MTTCASGPTFGGRLSRQKTAEIIGKAMADAGGDRPGHRHIRTRIAAEHVQAVFRLYELSIKERERLHKIFERRS